MKQLSKPRVVLVAHENEGSATILQTILKSESMTVVAVFITQGLYYRKTALQSIVKLLREASFLFCFNRFWDVMWYKLRRGETLKKICQRSGIEYFKTHDINALTSVANMKSLCPDYVLSSFTMHILGDEVIEIPKKAAIGVHPSLIPEYRGLEVFFWMMANGESNSGSSAFLLSKEVDKGDVVCQDGWNIDNHDTVVTVYHRLTHSCANLLVRAVAQFEVMGERGLKSIDPQAGRYFRMPTRACYKKFRLAGRKWR